MVGASVRHVVPIHRRQHDVADPPVRHGSSRGLGLVGSGGAGVEAVLTAQKRQPRVHVSPRIMTVAVPVSPFQHSPMLGHCASSHTVARDRVRIWT